MATFAAPQCLVVVRISSAVPTIIQQRDHMQGRAGDYYRKSFYPPSNNHNDAAILRGEIVIVPKEDAGAPQGHHTMPQGRSMINDLMVPASIPVDDHAAQLEWLYKHWRVIGVAREDVLIDSKHPEITPSSVVNISGMCTMPNTSKITIYPGDWIRARFPKTGNIQQRTNHKGAFSRQRLVMETSPLRFGEDPDDVREIQKHFGLKSNIEADAVFASTFFALILDSIVEKTAIEYRTAEITMRLKLTIILGAFESVRVGADRDANVAAVRGFLPELTLAQYNQIVDAADDADELARIQQVLLAATADGSVYDQFTDACEVNALVRSLVTEDLYARFNAAFTVVDSYQTVRATMDDQISKVDAAHIATALGRVTDDGVKAVASRGKKWQAPVQGFFDSVAARGPDIGQNRTKYSEKVMQVMVTKRMDVAQAICSTMGEGEIGVAQTIAKPGFYFDIMTTPSWMPSLSRL